MTVQLTFPAETRIGNMCTLLLGVRCDTPLVREKKKGKHFSTVTRACGEYLSKMSLLNDGHARDVISVLICVIITCATIHYCNIYGNTKTSLFAVQAETVTMTSFLVGVLSF